MRELKLLCVLPVARTHLGASYRRCPMRTSGTHFLGRFESVEHRRRHAVAPSNALELEANASTHSDLLVASFLPLRPNRQD